MVELLAAVIGHLPDHHAGDEHAEVRHDPQGVLKKG